MIRHLFRTSRIQAGLLLALLLVLFGLPPLLGPQSYLLYLLFTLFIFAVFGHAWNLLAGFGGMLSFGNQVYVGVGGFVMAIGFFYAELNIWLAWLLGGVAALALAWLLAIPTSEHIRGGALWRRIGVAAALWGLYEIGIALSPRLDLFGSPYVRSVLILLLIFLGSLPLLKLQGAYFAVATWLIAESFGAVFTGWKVVGAGGGMQVKTNANLLQLYYAALLLLVAATYLIWRILRSRYGLALTALRDDEEAAQSVGVDIRRMKLLIFLLSGLLSGLAAGLFYIDAVIITPPAAFTIFWSAAFVFVVVSGGMGTLAGPIVGAAIYILIDRIIGAYVGQGLLGLGLAAIAFMLFLPRGVMGLVQDLRASGQGNAFAGLRNPLRTLLQALIGWRVAAQQATSPAPVGRSALPALARSAGGAVPQLPAKSARHQREGVVCAFLVSGSPLPLLKGDTPPWRPLVAGFHAAQRALEEARPDVMLLYSTQWLAVLDQLWQQNQVLRGVHVDENWHELGELPYALKTDVELATRCVEGSARLGLRARGVAYDDFPIDTGTIVASSFLLPEGRIPLVIAANNVYHDAESTWRMAKMAVEEARALRRRVALVAVGGLSGTLFRQEIEPSQDRIATASDDDWNRRILGLLEAGNVAELKRLAPEYARLAKVDMGFKHLYWLLGGLNDRMQGGVVHAYAPAWGSGQAVVQCFPG